MLTITTEYQHQAMNIAAQLEDTSGLFGVEYDAETSGVTVRTGAPSQLVWAIISTLGYTDVAVAS